MTTIEKISAGLPSRPDWAMAALLSAVLLTKRQPGGFPGIMRKNKNVY